jgi:triosephosphate isomerase
VAPAHDRAIRGCGAWMTVLIGTSWKMNLTLNDAVNYFRVLRPLVDGLDRRELFVLPPFPAIPCARDELSGTGIAWGAQDVHEEECGAHTGDVSAPMLVALGCRYAEIGHSERRRDYCETNARVAAKVRTALAWGLTPILCVGEPSRRPEDVARRIVVRQLSQSLAEITSPELSNVVVAYEPVWAIGEGATAAPIDHIRAMHTAIRRWFERKDARARVIYGGSVNVANAALLLAQPGVDGVFVGRAALDPRAFATIARSPVPETR